EGDHATVVVRLGVVELDESAELRARGEGIGRAASKLRHDVPRGGTRGEVDEESPVGGKAGVEGHPEQASFAFDLETVSEVEEGRDAQAAARDRDRAALLDDVEGVGIAGSGERVD